VLTVLKRRHNALDVLIYPSEVQGVTAASQISDGIDYLSTQTDVDVILITRGGGSLEDLWPFNDERVARAIVRSLKPVISAVGHEVDFTIADFVSDLRAPTPSAAAEIVIQSKDVLSQRVVQLENRLHGSIRYRMSTLRHFLVSKVGSRGFAVAEAQVRRLAQRVDDLGFRLLQFGRPGTLTQSRAHRVELSETRLTHVMEQNIQKLQQSFSRVAGTLDALSPLAVLDRGYAVCQTPDGRVVRAADAVDVNSAVRVRLSRGSLIAVVTSRE
jgi:exodeoxyribonuclease VII large subunit